VKKREKKYKTLVLGLEHFIDKIGYQALAYQYYQHQVTYLVLDKLGYSSAFSEKYNADVRIIPSNSFKRLLLTIFFLLRKEYTHIEIYHTGRLTYFYILLCKLTGKKILFILRGTEFDKTKNSEFWYIKLIKSLKLSDKILVKEYNLLEEAEKIISTSKILFLPNAIRVYSGKIPDYADRDIDILFLNTPRKERNLFLLIDALSLLLENNKKLNITIAGFSVLSGDNNALQSDYQKSVLDYIVQKQIDKYFAIKPFINNPYDYHIRSKVFVLPASYIFLNYSMLESMSCGTVPVVTKGDGWDKIITEENGFVSEFDHKQLAEQIASALIKENWENKSCKARETVINNYDIIKWGKKILTFQGII
jgi:glycosyltransferase involved in cell wall biosynthesis